MSTRDMCEGDHKDGLRCRWSGNFSDNKQLSRCFSAHEDDDDLQTFRNAEMIRTRSENDERRSQCAPFGRGGFGPAVCDDSENFNFFSWKRGSDRADLTSDEEEKQETGRSREHEPKGGGIPENDRWPV